MLWCNNFKLIILYYDTFIFFTTPVSVFRKSFVADCYIWWCSYVWWKDNNELICWWWCLTMSTYLLNLLSPPRPSFPPRIITDTYLYSGGDRYIYIYIYIYIGITICLCPSPLLFAIVDCCIWLCLYIRWKDNIDW